MNEAPKLNLTNSLKEYEYAKSLIPGAVAGIRRPYNFVEGEYPIYFDSGKGGHVTDIDGNDYIDYLCAYGPMIIGNRGRRNRQRGYCTNSKQRILFLTYPKVPKHVG